MPNDRDRDRDRDGAADLAQTILKGRSLIASVGEELEKKQLKAKQRGHHQRAAIPIPDVGGMDERVHQQALRVEQEVTLLVPDILARLVAGLVDRAPLFTAPFTLWLSMSAAVCGSDLKRDPSEILANALIELRKTR